MIAKNQPRAFTLIELLIVVMVVGLLAILVITALTRQISKSNDAKRKADLDRIKIALEEHEKDHNCYPSLNDDPTLMSCDPGTRLAPYLNKMPCDPVTHAPYWYESDDNVCPTWFRVYTNLDDPRGTAGMPLCGGPNGNSFNYYVSSPNSPQCLASGGSGGSGTGGSGGASPTPSGGVSGYWGCFNGVCNPVSWDYAHSHTSCDPHFSVEGCSNLCVDPNTGLPQNECVPLY